MFLFFFFFQSITILFSQDIEKAWGITSRGGLYNSGTVYSINTETDEFTKEYDFPQQPDGNFPKGQLVRGPDGKFYGVCSNGSNKDFGSIFRISNVSTGGVFEKLFEFNSSIGTNPTGGLLLGSDNNFYGMCTGGGDNSSGTVFKFSLTGTGIDLKKIYDFETLNRSPKGLLTEGSDGNLYGLMGFTSKFGIFTLSFNGIDYSFTTIKENVIDIENGYSPKGRLIEKENGVFLGICESGGDNSNGTIFRVVKSLSGFNFEKILDFDGIPEEIIKGNDGLIYGSFSNSTGGATVFRLTDSYGIETISSLNSIPTTSFFEYSPGVFYVGCESDDKWRNTSITKIDLNTSLSTNYLLTLSGGSLIGGFTKDESGNLLCFNTYGQYGFGGIIKFRSEGNVSSHSYFKSFSKAPLGARSYSNLIKAKDGYLYGVTANGGEYGGGTIFKFNPLSNQIEIEKVLDFDDSTGKLPQGGIIKGKNGDLYGMTLEGGLYNSGTIYKISISNNGYTFKKLWDFDADPINEIWTNLFYANDGKYYGMSRSKRSTIFRLTDSNNSSSLEIIYTFSGINNGSDPFGNLIQHNNVFYGLTALGGSYDEGTIFKFSLNPSGEINLTTLKSFNDFDEQNGSYPNGTLFKNDDNYFYGVTSFGGSLGNGTIFRFSISGSSINFEKLNDLDGTNFGIDPENTFIKTKSGSLITTCLRGGLYGYGTIIKLNVNTNGTTELIKVKDLNYEDGINPWAQLYIPMEDTILSSNKPNLAFNSKEISLYPNPNSGAFYISYSESFSNAEISIFNTNGSLVNQKILQNGIEKFNDLPKGLYLVKVKFDDYHFSSKILVE